MIEISPEYADEYDEPVTNVTDGSFNSVACNGVQVGSTQHLSKDSHAISVDADHQGHNLGRDIVEGCASPLGRIEPGIRHRANVGDEAFFQAPKQRFFVAEARVDGTDRVAGLHSDIGKREITEALLEEKAFGSIQETLKRGQASSLANSLRPRGIHTCLFLLTYYKNSNYYLLLSMISNRTARAAALGKNR